VTQQLREATGWGEGPRYLIRDNDDKFGSSFDTVAEATGIKIVCTPVRAPNANAVCERFLRSVRSECLDYVLILAEGHLRFVLGRYCDYFNGARPHRHRPKSSDPTTAVRSGADRSWRSRSGWVAP
jgi:transposase InsO family protein